VFGRVVGIRNKEKLGLKSEKGNKENGSSEGGES
jgi:hypothetical protein